MLYHFPIIMGEGLRDDTIIKIINGMGYNVRLVSAVLIGRGEYVNSQSLENHVFSVFPRNLNYEQLGTTIHKMLDIIERGTLTNAYLVKFEKRGNKNKFNRSKGRACETGAVFPENSHR